MNGIFGILKTDSSPVDPAWLEAMETSMAFWARDGSNTWHSGSLGMGCVYQYSTPEAVGESQPLHDSNKELTLIAGARLDNRSELLRKLDCPAQTVTDSQLILQAYLKWGEDCIHHFTGDWHFAIWDEKAHKLFIARDHHGNTGLYYFSDPHFFAFASSKKALLTLEAIPKKPNFLRVAQVLTAWPGDGTISAYEGIFRLPPAHYMSITRSELKISRYWYPENLSELHFNSNNELIEAFLETFTTAVNASLRCQYPLGVSLSGGLDSGSVAAIAAGRLRQQGKKLIALTSVPIGKPGTHVHQKRFGDETVLAQAVSRFADTEHILIRAEDISVLEGIQRVLEVHDEPVHAASNQYWIASLMEAAQQYDVGTLLTGQTGNATISWPGKKPDLSAPLMKGDIPCFMAAFTKERNAGTLGTWGVVRRYLLKPILRELRSQSQRILHPAHKTWQEYSAIRPEFARQLDLTNLMLAEGYGPQHFDSLPPLHQRLRIIQTGKSILGSQWLEKGAAFGMEVRDPTQDRRVIEFCLAIPDSCFRQEHMDRWLVRRAMQGFLPDEVRLNTRRGLQAADIGQRVLNNRSKVDEVLAHLKQHDFTRQVLDIPRIEAVLASLEHGINQENTAECATILTRGLMTGLFLLRFP